MHFLARLIFVAIVISKNGDMEWTFSGAFFLWFTDMDWDRASSQNEDMQTCEWICISIQTVLGVKRLKQRFCEDYCSFCSAAWKKPAM